MSEHENRLRWKGTPACLRQRYIAQDLTVPHPALISVMRELKRSVRRCKNESRGSAMLILAGSGCGKSHLIDLVLKHRPADHSGNVSVVPVVSFSVPSSPNQRSMSSALLRALEHPKCGQGSAQDMFSRAILQLKAVQTELIMIDNVHDIPERRRADGVMQVGNWIRELIDQSHCLVALFGTPAAVKVTEANAQLRRRALKQMRIRYFEFDSPESKQTFRRFLYELDKRLPLAEQSGLDEPFLMCRLHWATAGIADYIFNLVNEAVGLAVEAGRECIRIEDFENGFARLFQDSAIGINPFAVGGPTRPLDQPGEPFYKWFDYSNPHPDRPASR